MGLSILLADDHSIVRQGVREVLQESFDVDNVVEVSDGRAAVEKAGQAPFDLLVLDLSMPHLGGADALREIRRTQPRLPVVILSMHAQKPIVADALRAGATAFVLKDQAVRELPDAVAAALAGQQYLSPPLAQLVAGELAGQPENSPAASPVRSPLSPRERQVLQLVAEGKSSKEIAAQLNISVKTVETHRSQIMEKLDLHSIAQLTKFAIRQGLTTVE